MPEVRKLWQTEGLFSDHYLKARLKDNVWWPCDAEAQPAYQFCQELYEKRAFALRRFDNEMGVRQEFIDKILERLGFAWSDNLRLPETKQDLEPDYILYPDPETKESVLHKSVAERYRAGVGLLEAKRFGHPLSQISQHQRRYPHQQIRDYLQESDSIAWGILTNGGVWRLYCRDSKASHFFALNFEAALGSLQDFKVFLALFSSAAFARDAQGKCRLDQVRQSALATQTELEADLRQRIFTVVEILANGFAGRPENKITDASLPTLYENCLIFLYRLLFILYAEGRCLLPVEPKSRKYYKQLSLARLLTPLKNFSEYDSQTQTRFYRDIHALCLLINGTDKKANDEFGVPRYNGGLFDPDRYPLLKEWTIADAVLADVLRQLMFTPQKGGQNFVPFESVDYADLSVQQLGSIYEGLLEHHFVRARGQLVLQTDKAERKATGTYYTPDYVVKYIVEQTLLPLLEEIEQHEPVRAARAAGKQDNSFADEVLKLNICDPAMGSGHFLVEATTFLADHIVYHPTTRFQAEFVKGESQEETEIAYWRRRVVEACIYGVDLNPLAVELAKLSLWLTTISRDQPLNFLDHHLRRGNSLIGARLDQLGSLPQKKGKDGAQQIHFTFGPDFKQAVAETIRQIHEIEGQASLDVAAVKAKEKRWEVEILPRLAPYKRVADLWTNAFLDGPLSEEEYLAAAREMLVVAQEGADQLQEAAARYGIQELDKPYFHWELEFPEVFFNDDATARARPGFDAVVGNPPYVPTEEMNEAERALIPVFYPIAAGKYDLSVVFLRLGGRLLSKHRLLGMIVPVTWQTGDSYRPFRGSWSGAEDFSPVQVINLPFNVFRDAYIDTCIALFLRSRSRPVEVFAYSKKAKLLGIALAKADFETISTQEIEAERYRRLFTNKGHYAFLAKFANQSCSTLGEVMDACQGPVESFFKYSDRAESDDYLPYVTSDVYRYEIETTERKFVNFGRKNPLAKFYTRPRILIRRIVSRSNRLMAIAVEEWFVVKKDLNPFILRNSGPSLLYVLANVNSLLHSFLYTEASAAAGKDDFRQTTLAELQSLPIRRIEFTTPERKRASLQANARQLYERSLEDGKTDAPLALVAEQLAVKPERADVVHDLLAFLAEQMMALNRGKRAAAKQFLTDLGDFHGVDPHALKPKTKLDQFWKLEAAEVFAHFRANKLHLKDSDEERIRARFQNAKEKLLPLESSLALTDDLIDEIVYRLYALTPDEINLVKAAAK